MNLSVLVISCIHHARGKLTGPLRDNITIFREVGSVKRARNLYEPYELDLIVPDIDENYLDDPPLFTEKNVNGQNNSLLSFIRSEPSEIFSGLIPYDSVGQDHLILGPLLGPGLASVNSLKNFNDSISLRTNYRQKKSRVV